MTELLYLSERDWIIKKKWEDDAKHKKVDRLVKDLLVIMGRTRDELKTARGQSAAGTPLS